MNKEQQNIILDKSYKTIKITKEIKKDILKNPQKYSNCDVRIRMGHFYTDLEKEKYIEESLNRPLPGEHDVYIFQKKKFNK